MVWQCSRMKSKSKGEGVEWSSESKTKEERKCTKENQLDCLRKGFNFLMMRVEDGSNEGDKGEEKMLCGGAGQMCGGLGQFGRHRVVEGG